MILHPAIIALCSDSLLTCTILAYAAVFGVRILRRWDLASGSELQVELEHRTYLISTIMAICLVFQVGSLFLFINTTDSLCRLFPGAMCSAGTLNLNRFGYPVLVLKLVNAIVAGLWLIINHADNQGYDYPLIRVKYRMLLLIVPPVVVESLLLGWYFFSLHPHVITSCCGSLFSSASTRGASSLLAALPVIPLLMALYLGIALTLACGAYVLRRDRGGYLFALSCAASFIIGAAALIVSISVYLYGLPTHHCPFCMLHHEYAYVGYLLYGSLLGGCVAGVGVGGLQPFRQTESLVSVLPVMQRRLAMTAMTLYAVFAGVAACLVWFSDLHMR